MCAAEQMPADTLSEDLRCLIVDDSALFLRCAQDALRHQGIEVVGVALNSADALQRTDELRPDVVLVDICLGAESGFDLAAELSSNGNNAAVILISTHGEEDFEELVAASPTVGFLSKAALSSSAIKDLAARAGARIRTDGVVCGRDRMVADDRTQP